MSEAGDERMRRRRPAAPPGQHPDKPAPYDWRLGISPRPCPDCPPRGEQGEHGDRGERGATGAAGSIPPRIRRAFATLFVAMFLLIALAYAGLYYQQQAAGRQNCGSIAQTVRIPVPVPTAGNPSRVTWALYEQIERHRGMELGCRLPPARYAQSKP